jgi:hypothetical protein
MRMVIEMHFELVLIMVIRMKTWEDDTTYEKSMTYGATACFGLLCLFPLFVLDLALYYKKRPHWAKGVYDTIYADLDTKRFLYFLATPLFLMGRIFYVLVIILLQEWPEFQVILVTYLAVFQLCYLLYTMPYESAVMNIAELTNHIATWLIALLFFGFTDYVLDNERRYKNGWIVIYLVGAIIVFNLLLNLGASVVSLVKKLRRKYFTLRHRKRKTVVQSLLRTVKSLFVDSSSSSDSDDSSLKSDHSEGALTYDAAKIRPVVEEEEKEEFKDPGPYQNTELLLVNPARIRPVINQLVTQPAILADKVLYTIEE